MSLLLYDARGEPVNPSVDAPVFHETDAPVQHPGKDQIVAEQTVGGPAGGADIRLYLHVRALRELVDRAEASESGRVLMTRAGLRVRVYRTADGHTYQTWTLISDRPVPERPFLALPPTSAMPAGHTARR